MTTKEVMRVVNTLAKKFRADSHVHVFSGAQVRVRGRGGARGVFLAVFVAARRGGCRTREERDEMGRVVHENGSGRSIVMWMDESSYFRTFVF